MKKIKYLLLLIILIQVGCNESFDSKYSNYEEVKKDGAIFKGWIPKEIPQSAFEIKEWHELDNNVGCGSFRFNKNEIEEFIEKLKIFEINDQLNFRCFISREEWHNSEKVRDYKKLIDQGYRMYRTDKFIFAINLEYCRVYFWNLPSIKEV